MLTIYGRASSSNVQVVMWTVAELGLAHERLDYGHVHGGNDTADYLAMNPHGGVPTIRDGELVMWESAASARYLATRYGDGGAFWPADPAQRGRVDMWAEWGKGTLAATMGAQIFWPRVRTAAADRNAAALVQSLARFEALLDKLEAQLTKHPFVAGDDFTLADIMVGHQLYRWFDIDVLRQPRPVLERYYAALCERPAYRDHVMIDYSALRALGA